MSLVYKTNVNLMLKVLDFVKSGGPKPESVETSAD